MKIVITTAFFYPDITPRAFRATELAIEFAKRGIMVVVYLPENNFDYSEFMRHHNLKIKKYSQIKEILNYNKFKNKYIKTLISKIRSLLYTLAEYPELKYTYKLYSAVKNEKNIDVLISIAYPHSIHWGIALLRQKKNSSIKCWIADCGDPFMGNATVKHKKLFYFKYIEKWCFRKADYITIPIISAKPAYYKEFHNKIVVIPQGFNFSNINTQKYKPHNNAPQFAYAGTFYSKIRDPRPFLEYLSICQHNFVFRIFTDATELVMPYRKKLNSKLIIEKFIPRTELLNVLSEMDFLVNFDNNNNIQIPSKLIDYAITGRPILNIKKELNYKEIEAFISGDYSTRVVIDQLEKYNIINVANSFIELIK